MNTRATCILSMALLVTACGSTAPAESANVGDSSTGPESELAVPADCVNPPPDVTTLIEQDDRAACYGSDELTVETHATTLIGAVSCPGQLEPAWFGCGGPMLMLYPLEEAAGPRGVILAARGRPGDFLSAVVHPSYDIDLSHGLDTRVSARGHFDDPAARTCHYASWPDANPPPPHEVIHTCQSTFVITNLEPLDVDEPSATGAPAPGPSTGLLPHAVAQVIDTDLVIRTAPGVGPGSEMYPVLLDPPTLLYITDGPVSADGYDWYEVMPSGVDYLPTGYPLSGWVAAGGKDGAPWIGTAEIDCPSAADLLALVGLSDAATIACYGSDTLILEGVFDGCHPGSPEGPGAPSWLWSQRCVVIPAGLHTDVLPNPGTLAVRFEAHLGLREDQVGQTVRVTGHFDHTAARECTYQDEIAADSEYAVLPCRAQFVADSAAVLDTP
jgi:hypothetical protein